MRWLAAWVFYGLGDAVSRLMNVADVFGYLYPIYNRLMGWSVIIQGPSANGPWDACPLSNAASCDTHAKRHDREDGHGL